VLHELYESSVVCSNVQLIFCGRGTFCAADLCALGRIAKKEGIMLGYEVLLGYILPITMKHGLLSVLIPKWVSIYRYDHSFLVEYVRLFYVMNSLNKIALYKCDRKQQMSVLQ